MATILRMIADLEAGQVAGVVKELQGNADKLGRTLGNLEARVEDKGAQATLLRLENRASKLQDKLDTELTVGGTRKAAVELLTVEAAAERLDKKLSDAGGAKGGILGLLGRIGGAAGTVGPALGPVGIGAAVAGGAALAPAAIPYALGTGLGGLGAILTDPKGLAGILKTMMSEIRTALAPLKPLFAGVLGTLPGIVKQLAPGLRDVFAYSVPYLKAFVGLIDPVAKIILPAIAKILREMLPSLPTMSKSLLDIAEGMAMFLNAMGPRGIQASAKIFEVLAVTIEAGLAGSGAALNAFAVTLKFLWNVIGTGAKYAISAFEDFARVATRETRAIAAFVAPKFDELRHHVANIFDGMRHDIANVFDIIRHIIPAAWDAIWNSTSLKNTRGVQEIRNLFGDMQHGIASTFDTVRHVIASAWDTIWNNTVGRVRRGISDVVGFFHGLLGKIVNALAGIGSKIYSLGHGWLVEMGNGIKRAWDDVMHWLEGLPGRILHALGIHSPPSWAIDAGKHIMSGITHGLKLGVGDVLSFVAGVPGRIGNLAQGFLFNTVEPPGALARFGNAGTGPPTAGNVVSWLTAAMRDTSAPGSWLPALERIVSLESGGNPRAFNPSGASGLMQTIPSTYAAYATVPGGIWNPISNAVAAIRYIMAQYGSPFNIPGLFSGHYQGYALGTPSAMAGWAWVGERGPELVRFRGGEQVTPAVQRGGRLVHVENMYVREPEDVALVASKLSFKITASGFG